MAAPKNPNTTEANRKRREQGDTTAANRLADAGYLVLSPAELGKLSDEMRKDLRVAVSALDVRVPLALTDRRPHIA